MLFQWFWPCRGVCREAIWGLKPILFGMWAILASMLADFWSSSAVFGGAWEHLAASWAVLRRASEILGRSWAILGRSSDDQGGLGGDLGRSWGCLVSILDPSWGRVGQSRHHLEGVFGLPSAIEANIG